MHQIDEKNEDAVKVMNKMNVHMHGIVNDLNEVDSLVNVIKTKKLNKKWKWNSNLKKEKIKN